MPINFTAYAYGPYLLVQAARIMVHKRVGDSYEGAPLFDADNLGAAMRWADDQIRAAQIAALSPARRDA